MYYFDFWGEDVSKWSLLFCCKICLDGIGEFVDFVVVDNWFGGLLDCEFSKLGLGINVVIVCIGVGFEFFKVVEQVGVVMFEYDFKFDDMSYYQFYQMWKKYVVWLCFDGIEDVGYFRLVYEGLCLQELVVELLVEVNDV